MALALVCLRWPACEVENAVAQGQSLLDARFGEFITLLSTQHWLRIRDGDAGGVLDVVDGTMVVGRDW